jgi:hypothetical protein
VACFNDWSIHVHRGDNFGHNIQSPCASVTEQVFILCGQGPAGKPSHLGTTVSAANKRMNEDYSSCHLANQIITSYWKKDFTELLITVISL